MLKDSDIYRSLLNEIKNKFISDKKRKNLGRPRGITDLVLVKSNEEKEKIASLLDAANLEFYVDEDSFKVFSRLKNGQAHTIYSSILYMKIRKSIEKGSNATFRKS